MATRKLTVQILGDSKSLERAFARSESASKKFGAGIKVAGVAAAAGVAAFGVAIVKGVTAASDLSEQLNKSAVVFGKHAKAVEAWSKTTADAFGISQRQALEAAGGFGQMLQTAGVATKASAGMSRKLVELAADLASFNNIDPTAALEKLRSGLAGEAEPLRTVGVFLSEARVQAEAYASGIAKSGSKLTEAQKVQARYNLILQDTGKAQGDFARTSDSLANSTRRIKAQFEEGAAALGGLFLPAVADAADAVAGFLGDIRKARGIKAKFSVATEGLENLGKQIFNAAKQSIERIDWAKLFDTIKAAFNRIDDILSSIDWDAVFRTVSDAIGDAFQRLTAIVDSIDWQEVGRRIGRAIAGALEAAAKFLQSVDWSAVGQAIAERFKQAIVILVKFLAAVDWKRIAIGIVKLLAAALKAVTNLLLGIGKGLGKALLQGIGVGIDSLSQFVLRKLLEFVKKVLGVTGFLGRFDPFKGVRQKVQRQLDAMEADAKTAAGNINRALGGIKDQAVNVAITIRTSTIGGGRRPEEGALGAERVERENAALEKSAKNIGATVNARKAAYAKVQAAAARAATVTAKAAADATKAAKVAAARATAARKKAREAFDALMESLDLKLTIAQDAGSFKRTLRVLDEQEKAIRKQIAVEGRTTDLLRQLHTVMEARATAEEDLATFTKSAKQAREFRKLGLTPEGEKPLPGLENLVKQWQSLSKRIDGTPLERKYAGMLKRIGSVLKSGTKRLEDGTTRAILEMFDGIRGAFADGGDTIQRTATSALNANKVLAGIGLSPQEMEKARGRLASFAGPGITVTPRTRATAFAGVIAGGASPVTVENTIYLDGAVIARSTKRYLDNDRVHNPRQKRGPNAGR